MIKAKINLKPKPWMRAIIELEPTPYMRAIRNMKPTDRVRVRAKVKSISMMRAKLKLKPTHTMRNQQLKGGIKHMRKIGLEQFEKIAEYWNANVLKIVTQESMSKAVGISPFSCSRIIGKLIPEYGNLQDQRGPAGTYLYLIVSPVDEQIVAEAHKAVIDERNATKVKEVEKTEQERLPFDSLTLDSVTTLLNTLVNEVRQIKGIICRAQEAKRIGVQIDGRTFGDALKQVS